MDTLKELALMTTDQLLTLAKFGREQKMYATGYSIALYLSEEHRKDGIDLLYEIKGSVPEFIDQQRPKNIMLAFATLFPLDIINQDEDFLHSAIGFLDCVYGYDLVDGEMAELVEKLKPMLKAKAIAKYVS